MPKPTPRSVPKPPRHVRKHLSEGELRQLLRAARRSLRDLALVSVAYDCALRAAEVGWLTLEHAQKLPEGRLFVSRAKGSKSDWCDLSPSTVQALSEWIEARYPGRRRPSWPIFPGGRFLGDSPKGIARVSVWRIVRRLCLDAEISIEVAHPHSLRHARVMHLLEAAGKKRDFPFESLAPALAKLVGHTTARTTIQHYMSETRGARALIRETTEALLEEES